MSMNLVNLWNELNSPFPPDKIWCEEVIIATNMRKGDGTEGNPIRIVTQVFTKKGSLIAEYDPELYKNQQTPAP